MNMGNGWALFGMGLGLAVFGVAYNALTAWLERNARHEGYTALLVVGGVFITVAASALVIGLQSALVVGAGFVCSGTPMIIGSVHRHVMMRERERETLRAFTTIWSGEDGDA